LRWTALCCAVVVASSLPAVADDDAPDLAALVGKKINVVPKTGKMLEDVEVTKVTPGTAPGSVKAMTVKVPPTGRLQAIVPANVDDILCEAKPLDVVYDIKTRELVHSRQRREARLEKEARVDQQLKAKRARLWPDFAEEEQEKFVAEEKEFLDKVAKDFPGTLYETKYYLFYTDMPAQQISGYIAYLDDMYKQLCKAYGVPEGKNVWRGKCVVVAFVAEKTFGKFEEKIMANSSWKGAQGLAHSYGNGRVLISCFRGPDPLFFATVLVHETSHGFVHRYKSSARIPSWINEGIADWVAAAVVRADDSVENRQHEAARIAKQSGTLGGNFFADKNIEDWQYGAASAIVDMMLKMGGGKQYRELIDGIKEGLDWEDSLKQAFNMSPAELTATYGKYIGAPNLRP
jgi:hypothetical protein